MSLLKRGLLTAELHAGQPETSVMRRLNHGPLNRNAFPSTDGKGVFVAQKDSSRAIIHSHGKHGVRTPMPRGCHSAESS
eukprot:scaffold506032_cov17-Prasinocladus_malaysianus.AAC.4